MELKPGDDMAHFKYEAHEYFVSGTANGQPYTTRIVVRRPADAAKFSGLVLAESMHPSGNAWMFHFTHAYSMTTGHVGLDILTSTSVPFAEFNAERYKSLRVGQGQAPEILAQVGALMKSKQPGNPLAALPVRKMILAGTSASAAALINYLPAHMVLRLSDMKPIYDGFLPTSTGATIRQIDVPMIQVPTMTEVMSGTATARQDGDAPGDQFRVYEFPGMAHIDSRDAAAYYPNPVQASDQPIPARGVHVRRAQSSLAVGGQGHGAAEGRPHPRRSQRRQRRLADGARRARQRARRHPERVRGRAGEEVRRAQRRRGPADSRTRIPSSPCAAKRRRISSAAWRATRWRFSQAELKKLYKDKKDYVRRVERSLDEATKQGWFLPVYRSVVLADAAAVGF